MRVVGDEMKVSLFSLDLGIHPSFIVVEGTCRLATTIFSISYHPRHGHATDVSMMILTEAREWRRHVRS